MTLQPLDTYAHDAVVRDGRTVHVRPIRPDDLDGLMDMWGRLSAESIRMRFFAPRKMTREQMRYFVDVDYTTRFAAVAEQGGHIIGVSRFDVLEEDPTRAEFAVLVEDAHQGRGVGTVLLRALMAPADDLGVTGFVADVLRENRRMLSVLRDAGLSPAVADDGYVVHASFPTTPTEEYLQTADVQDRKAAVAALSSVFSPASIAVVGASRDRSSVGGMVFAHLLAGGFTGAVYPVNPAAPHVQSVAAYPSLADCPTTPELVVVCVPADGVVEVVGQAADVGSRAVVVLSAGFSEAGAEGAERERALVEAVRASGMRLVGPNCMGVLNAASDVRMNATFSPVLGEPGRVGFSSQSGALGLAILAAAERLGIGLSSFISVGNKPDISGNDLLQYWEDDDATDVILLYLESFGNPRKFGRLARRIGRSKPIAAVTSGLHRQGGATAGPRSAGVAVDALFRQAGVVRTDTLSELFEVTSVLANQPLPAGDRVAVLTNGGGPGTLAADACTANGLRLAALAEQTCERLRDVLGDDARIANPVDTGANVAADVYGAALRILAADPGVDALVVIFVPPVVTRAEDVARAVAAAAGDVAHDRDGDTATDDGTSPVPVVSVFMAEQVPTAVLRAARVPAFAFPEDAAKALGRVARYARWRREPLGNVVEVDDADREGGREVVDAALTSTDACWLTADDATRLLRAYGIGAAPALVVHGPDEAAQAAAELGGPVAVKLAASVDKSRIGGVRLGVDGPDAAAAAVRDIAGTLAEAGDSGAADAGFLVQQMVSDGVEMTVGVTTDPSFGPLVTVGLGGALLELLADVSVRIHPLTDTDVEQMLTGLRGYELLRGYRGSEPVDTDALATLLFRVSAMVEDLPELDELHIDPVFVRRRGVSCVDVRVRVARRGRRRET